MVYQYRFLHVFMSLFFFYVLICFVSVSVYLLTSARELYIDMITNPYVWMLYAPEPLFMGICLSLLFAGIVQWVYRCKIDGEKLFARDTWGNKIVIDSKDIVSVHTYAIPFMPLSRLKLENAAWSAWIPKNAALNMVEDT